MMDPRRPLRADAQRNRDAILRAARTVFENDGVNAPLDGIATAAGIGNATLYRNFPTRDDLLAAVIEGGVAELLEASRTAAAGTSSAEALRRWLSELAWQLRVWQDLPTCIATAVSEDGSPVRPVSERLTERTSELLARAVADGAARADVSAAALFELVTAIAWAIDRFRDDAAAARARIELATAGVFLAD
jgi:AcrR family transcriptional regulator